MDEVEVKFTSQTGTEVSFSTTSSDSDRAALVDNVTTRLGTGHESAKVKLARDPVQRHDDVDWLQQVEITGADGFQIFKGSVTGIPPESGRLVVNAAGNFSILKDRPGCSEIYVDRSLERWQGLGPERRGFFLTNNFTPADAATEGASLFFSVPWPPWTSTGLPVSGLTYVAPPGCAIGNLSASAVRTSSNFNVANYDFYAILSDDELLSSYDISSEFAGSLASAYALSLDATADDRRYAELSLRRVAATDTADSLERAVRFTEVAVTGTHGITSLTPDAIIKHVIDKWCPGLTYDSQSIAAHPFIFGHFVADRESPADIIARANSVANWDFNVWGDTFYFQPAPSLRAPDYILDIEDGDTLAPTGQSVSEERPVNYAQVHYNDALTGRDEIVEGSDDSRLRVDDPEHPCNREGRTRVLKVDIDGPCDEDQAIQIGSLALAEQQVPSRSGSGSASGTVRTADGNRVPANHIRAGDVVLYSHESVGRQVQSTSYQPALGKVDLEFDDRAASLKAMLARMGVALTMAGSK